MILFQVGTMREDTKCNIKHCNTVMNDGCCINMRKISHQGGRLSRNGNVTPLLLVSPHRCVAADIFQGPQLRKALRPSCHLVAFAPIITKRFERPALTFIEGPQTPPSVQIQGGIKSVSDVASPVFTHLESRYYRGVSTPDLYHGGPAGPLNFVIDADALGRAAGPQGCGQVSAHWMPGGMDVESAA